MGRPASSLDTFKNIGRRVSHTIFQKTTPSLAGDYERCSNTSFKGNGPSNPKNERNANTRKCGTVAQFSFKDFLDSKGGWLVPSNFQFKEIKRLCLDKQVSTNKSPRHTVFPTAQRLASKDRFVECLLPSSDGNQSQTFFKTNIQQRTSSNDLPSIRLSIGSKNFCHNDQLGRADLKKSRHQSRDLFGRFFVGQPGQARALLPCTGDCSSVRVIGLANQLQEINTRSSEIHSVLGYNMGYVQEHENSATTKAHCHKTKTSADASASEIKSKGIAISNRGSKLLESGGSTRPVALPPLASALQSSFEQRSNSRNSTSRERSVRCEMVVKEPLSNFHPASTGSIPLPLHRRFGFRLGRSARQREVKRLLESERTESTLKSKRNVSSIESPPNSLSATKRKFDFHTVGQQNCPFISSKGRRHSIEVVDAAYLSSFPYTSRVQHPLVFASPARQVQCGSGSPLSRISASGVAFASNPDRENFREMGRAGNRSICIGSCTCCSQVCVSGHNGLQSGICRRFLEKMAVQSSVGVPTPISDTQGSCTHEQSDRSVFNGSPQMGESLLASGPQKASGSSPVHYPQLGKGFDRYRNESASAQNSRSYDGNMEMWGWEQALTDWTPEQKELLMASWRSSTKKSYLSAWKRWCSWASRNNIDYCSPSGSDLARYLSDLFQKENLSYNTILLHKSVVCTLSDPNRCINLGSHPMVVRILKSISIQKPKNIKPPVWDVDKVSSWLANNFVLDSTFYECLRRTACILLLCSGRRVHDLTLLSIDPELFTVTDHHVTFWPLFGSKTDSANYQQSGWQLLNNTQSEALNPVFWVKSIIKLSKSRRDECKNSNLFLTVRGVPKPATRAVIANWVKSLLQEAGVQASAGSVRSAVASKHWLLNFPLDDILARGNWRSHNTFSKFYRRAIMRESSGAMVVSTFFQPV